MVVVPVSPHKCAFCENLSQDFRSHSVCTCCGKPQPVGRSPDLQNEDFFAVLGVPRKFQQNLKDLQKHYYELSRLLHPDRFSTAPSEVKQLSLERMSWVNQAYAILSNPSRLREYLLDKEGYGEKNNPSAPPLELAEAWFEIQDLLLEDPAAAQTQLVAFEEQIHQLIEGADRRLFVLEKSYDIENSRTLLEKMSHEFRLKSYLMSMKKDVEKKNLERIKKNANSD